MRHFSILSKRTIDARKPGFSTIYLIPSSAAVSTVSALLCQVFCLQPHFADSKLRLSHRSSSALSPGIINWHWTPPLWCPNRLILVLPPRSAPTTDILHLMENSTTICSTTQTRNWELSQTLLSLLTFLHIQTPMPRSQLLTASQRVSLWALYSSPNYSLFFCDRLNFIKWKWIDT